MDAYFSGYSNFAGRAAKPVHSILSSKLLFIKVYNIQCLQSSRKSHLNVCILRTVIYNWVLRIIFQTMTSRRDPGCRYSIKPPTITLTPVNNSCNVWQF